MAHGTLMSAYGSSLIHRFVVRCAARPQAPAVSHSHSFHFHTLLSELTTQVRPSAICCAAIATATAAFSMQSVQPQVAEHYNQIRQKSREERQSSEILGSAHKEARGLLVVSHVGCADC